MVRQQAEQVPALYRSKSTKMLVQTKSFNAFYFHSFRGVCALTFAVDSL